MFDKIIDFDKNLLVSINNFKSDFFDDFFFIFSGQLAWLLTATVIISVLIINQKKDFVFVVLALVLLIALSDHISSGIIKKLVERQRPTHEPTLEGMVNIVHNYKGGGFSFVSSHAANGFAFATFSALLMKNRMYSITQLVWAFFTGYSRLYLGVHYPLDVLCGSIVGIGAGFLVYFILKKTRPACCQKPVTNLQALWITGSLVLTLAVISIWHGNLLWLA
ncbi:MAG: phosphatase PAP2 family protein [Prevotellaceae bacterium]|nr:phosphatase PAP2 family protein [Prevotellaceae bacterium]